MKREIPKIKKANPDILHKDAFLQAAQNWKALSSSARWNYI